MAFEFSMTDKVIAGEGALGASIPYMKDFGKKALILSGPNNRKLGNVDELADLLKASGVAYAIFSDITGEPTDRMIDAGLAFYQAEQCDFLVAIGGGSPIDAMKAVALLSAAGGAVSGFMGKTITQRLPKMAAIPTTAGTGSETTQFTIITDTKEGIKMLIKGSSLIPNLAVVDSKFTGTAPKHIVAATGLDALTHAIEAYTSKKAQPLADIFALSAVKRIFEYLPIVYHDIANEKAREEMAVAAFEAGVSINNSSVTLVHGMSRPIGALFHLPHGISNAMLLKDCLSFALNGAYERFAILGRTIQVATPEDSDEEAGKKFLEAVVEICKVCEVPTLKEYGISESEFFVHIDKMIHDAFASGSPQNTIKPISAEDMAGIYKNLWV